MRSAGRAAEPIARAVSVGALVLAGFLATACETVPRAQIDEAHSLEPGVRRVELGYSPGLGVSAAQGIARGLDAGAQLDLNGFATLSAWLKLSLVDRPLGGSFALLGGGFSNLVGGLYQGVFAGPLASYRRGILLVSLRARYSVVDFADDSVVLDTLEDNGLLYEQVLQTDASVRVFLAEDRLSLKAGFGCQRGLGSPRRDVVGLDNGFCAPSVAVTFYR